MRAKEITSLREYIATEFTTDEQLIRRLRSEMDGSLQMFATYCGDKGWAYEVGEDSFKEPEKISVSTNAMIAHAVSMIYGRIQDSTLCPKLDWFSKPKIGFGSRLDGVIDLLGRVVEEQRKTDSGTYGQNDPFSLLWLIELSAQKREQQNRLAANLEPIVTSSIEQWSRRLESERPLLQYGGGGGLKNEFSEHAFPAARVAHICYHLRKTLDESKLPAGLESLEKSLLKFLRRRLNDCLAEAYLGQYEFDPTEAIFAADGCLHLDPSAVTEEFVDKLFGMLLAGQSATGPSPWVPRRAFVRTQQGLALRPLAVEVFMSLLRICSLVDGDVSRRLFARHRQIFDDYSRWLLTRIVKGECGAKKVKFTGWYSEHSFAPRRIHFWETALVLSYVVSYIGFVLRHRAYRTLEMAALRQARRKRMEPVVDGSASSYWNTYKQVYDPLQGWDGGALVYGEIRDAFLGRGVPGATGTESDDWSMLLYGPPGTGKTTVAEAIAESLGWPLVTITPSDFVIDGDAMVESRAKDIFFALQQQREIVVLFDEIDQLIIDRSSKEHGDQGDMLRLMTPSMLVKLQDLRDLGRLIFVVATNYEERIDRAIKRKGRFDWHYLISLPNLKYRQNLLTRMIGSRLIKASLAKLEEAGSPMRDPFFVENGKDSIAAISKRLEPDNYSKRKLIEELLSLARDVDEKASKRTVGLSIRRIAEKSVLQGWGELKQHASKVIDDLSAPSIAEVAKKGAEVAAVMETSYAPLEALASRNAEIPEALVNCLLLLEVPDLFDAFMARAEGPETVRMYCRRLLRQLPQFKTNCSIFESERAKSLINSLMKKIDGASGRSGDKKKKRPAKRKPRETT